VGTFIRALIVLHRTFGSFPPRTRLHTLVRFLTCPFLRVAAHVPPGARVLDIGAGHGVFARLALDRGAARVVAVEPDFRKVRPIHGIDFVIGYDSAIGGTHDVISVIDVLYKVPIAEWDALLGRIAERLAPGGLLLIKEQDPTARFKNSWNRAQEWIATKLRLTLGESFTYESPDAFAARLQRHGFTSVRVRRIDSGYPHPHILYVVAR
jgi:cyclopropane fatty-acyl-phospholipid synthase-like methyltransferase